MWNHEITERPSGWAVRHGLIEHRVSFPREFWVGSLDAADTGGVQTGDDGSALLTDAIVRKELEQSRQVALLARHVSLRAFSKVPSSHRQPDAGKVTVMSCAWMASRSSSRAI